MGSVTFCIIAVGLLFVADAKAAGLADYLDQLRILQSAECDDQRQQQVFETCLRETNLAIPADVDMSKLAASGSHSNDQNDRAIEALRRLDNLLRMGQGSKIPSNSDSVEKARPKQSKRHARAGHDAHHLQRNNNERDAALEFCKIYNANTPEAMRQFVQCLVLACPTEFVMEFNNRKRNVCQTVVSPKNKSTNMRLLGEIIMDDKADRKNNFVVLDLDEKGNFVPVYYYEWKMMDGNVTLLPRVVRTAVWAKGKVGMDDIPRDVPVCGFDGSLCQDDRVMAISATCATIGTLFILFVVVIFFVRRNQKRAMTKTIWRVDYDKIDFSKTLTHSRSQRSLRNSKRGFSPGESSFSRMNMSTSVSIPSLMDDDYIDEVRKQIFTLIGMYRGTVAAVRKIRKTNIQHSFSLYEELARMRALVHPNVNAFIGACLDLPNPLCLVWTYCGRGSLADVLWNEEMKLDTHFKWSFMADISKGMDYLHHSFLESHGRLKSTNIVVDSRWTCKVTDYGARSVLQGEAAKEGQNEDAIVAELYWTAPELLRLGSPPRYGTKKGDIYSFGIIIKEIHTRSGPYSEFEDLKPKDITMRIENPTGDCPFRPRLDLDCLEGDSGAVGIAKVCWDENPDERPSFSKVIKMISHYRKGMSTNIMDNMVQMLEKYADNLEDVVAERTELLEQEKRKTDLLLYRMLPPSVADALKQGRRVDAEWYDDVTIYFSDVVSFTTLASKSTPMQIVDMLNSLYTIFDDVISLYDVYKVETIGDAYMIVSGLPERNGRNHVAQIADTALRLRHTVDTGFAVPHLPNHKLQIRIGLHTGPCASGVVGLAMPRYCLFGDTVNTASRMESHGEAMKIHMSNDTYQALSEQGRYKTICRGEVLIKGKGPMVTYWLEGKEDQEPMSRTASFEDIVSDNENDHLGDEILVNGGSNGIFQREKIGEHQT